jgi:DNA polymerase III delta subunit
VPAAKSSGGSASGAKSSTKSASGTKSAAKAAAPSGPARVLLIAGSDAAKKTAEANRLLQVNTDESFADFDAETLDGASATAERALAGVAMVPLGGGKKVVLIRDTQQMEAEEQKRLASGLARIPESGLLILHTGIPIIEDGKTKKASVVATELGNAVKKFGQVIELTLPKADDVRGWVIQEAQALGKKVTPDALTLFAQLPGDDLNRLAAEVAKAAAHAGDSPAITGADVEATLTRGPDDVIFKLCDAVGNRNAREALGYVSTLFRSGSRPDSVAPRTLVLLARQFRLLAQFRYLGEKRMAGRGAGPVTPEVMALLPSDGAGGMLANPRMAWMADKYVGQARRFSGEEIAYRLERLLHADLMLKGIEPGGDAPQAVLQRLVVELC